MCASGNHLKKHRFVPLPARILVNEVFTKNNVPEGVSGLVNGGREVGEWLAERSTYSADIGTGSTRMGKAVGLQWAHDLGRVILGTGRKQCHHYFTKMPTWIWPLSVRYLVQWVQQASDVPPPAD